MEIVGCRGLVNCCSFLGRSSACRIGVAAAAAAVVVVVAAAAVAAVVAAVGVEAEVVRAVARVVAGDNSIRPTKVTPVRRRCIRQRVGCPTDPS